MAVSSKRITDPKAFIRENAALIAPPLAPEIKLYLAGEVHPIWQATEEELAERDLPPPYWAFAWAGGQALARYLFDEPDIVRGKRVLDFGAGSGLVAIAAAKCGAASVEATDIDRFAIAAMELNCGVNNVEINAHTADLLGQSGDWDVVLAGDVCFEQPMAGHVAKWLRKLATAGKTVLLGDPIRAYLPREGLERLIRYSVAETSAVEDTATRNAIVWRVLPG